MYSSASPDPAIILAEAGKCVILVSHSPQVAKMCDECYELKRVGKKK